jgi:hypothetical protein
VRGITESSLQLLQQQQQHIKTKRPGQLPGLSKASLRPGQRHLGFLIQPKAVAKVSSYICVPHLVVQTWAAQGAASWSNCYLLNFYTNFYTSTQVN